MWSVGCTPTKQITSSKMVDPVANYVDVLSMSMYMSLVMSMSLSNSILQCGYTDIHIKFCFPVIHRISITFIRAMLSVLPFLLVCYYLISQLLSIAINFLLPNIYPRGQQVFSNVLLYTATLASSSIWATVWFLLHLLSYLFTMLPVTHMLKNKHELIVVAKYALIIIVKIILK